MLREIFHKYKWSLYMKFSRGLVQCTCFMTSIFVCKLFFISKIWFLKRYYNKNYLINLKKSFSLINFKFSISSTDRIIFSFLQPWSGRSPWLTKSMKRDSSNVLKWKARRKPYHVLPSVHLFLNKASFFVVIIITTII
jgi:hypothetical protein